MHPSHPPRPTWTRSDSFRQVQTKLANFPFLIMRLFMMRGALPVPKMWREAVLLCCFSSFIMRQALSLPADYREAFGLHPLL